MSEEPEELAAADTGHLISDSENTVGSSISPSLGESSVRIGEKFKTAKKESENLARNRVRTEENKWWLKRPETRLGISMTAKNSGPANGTKDTQTPDVTASMKEFLEKEELCKAQQKNSGDINREKDDTLCDILASAAFDKYPSDFENATDEDIGSFLEEMSKIAGALSPSSAQERGKSGEDSSKNPTEEEKSVEELLEEAEKLVRENVGLSKSSSRSETLINDETENRDADKSIKVRHEKDIFQLIEREVHRESEKIRKSPKNEKKLRETSPGYEIIYENVNSLKPPSLGNLELQKKRYDEDRADISSSSDLDDPIDRHSKSEDTKNIDETREDKENLQKEITDVDKDFFDDLLRRSREKIEGGLSTSSSFGQEDFSHFLRILQGQDRREQDMKERRIVSMRGDTSKRSRVDDINTTNDEFISYPEREITEILAKELSRDTRDERVKSSNDKKNSHEFDESDSSVASVEMNLRKKKTLSRNSSGERCKIYENTKSVEKIIENNTKRDNISLNCHNLRANDNKNIEHKQQSCDNTKSDEAKKVINSKSELYTVGLTPRLELFADAIPKLIAERTNEISNNNVPDELNDKYLNVKTKPESEIFVVDKNNERSSEIILEKEFVTRENLDEKNLICTESAIFDEKNDKIIAKSIDDRTKIQSRINENVDNTRLGKSKSYDQLSKHESNLRCSMDDVRNLKSTDPPRRIYQHTGKTSLGLSKYSKKPTTKHVDTSKQAPIMKQSLRQTTMKFDIMTKSSNTRKTEKPLKYCQAGGDSGKIFTKNDLDALFREEKHKNILLKEQLESEAKIYKQQMQNMRSSFEKELFALKKQNIILKAKIDELSLSDKRVGVIGTNITTINDNRVKLLEKELEKQENITKAYETENKRLVIEMENLNEEMKYSKLKQCNKIDTSQTQRLNDEIKDLRENCLKLNLELTDLREKNIDAALKIDDATQQNCLLKEELEMFKEQLRTKNDFINSRLQTITASELESRKKIDDTRVELSSKSEQLKDARSEYAKLEQAFLSLENELLEIKTRESGLMEKLQISKSHVEREKQLTIKLKDQVIIDNKKILDLNRQVREMERILKRKNPDSVSALVLTAKSDNEMINLEKIKLLENRIETLENEIRTKEEIGRGKLIDLQNKFAEMREKYVVQVMELEEKLLVATTRDCKIYNDTFTQTIAKSTENKCIDAIISSKRDERERSSSVQMDRDEKRETRNTKIGPKSQNSKEDAHLIATIRGLKMEISSKDKSIGKISKEYQELQKTNRRLQKERERLLNDRRNFKVSADIERNGRTASACTDQRVQGVKTHETNDSNSNNCQNGNISNGNGQILAGSVTRLYDPLRYSENDDRTSARKLNSENEILKEELSKINKDFMTLKNKRLHDLNLLQEEHEREMASLVKEYSVKFGDSKVVKLQGQINTQVAIITHLKQQIEKLRDYKEQVLVLKVEREHLENKVKILNEKVKYLSTPGTEQLQLLQDKITILQQRHESREMTLQSLVRDLLRNKTQCRDCKGEKGKSNKQLCYFRQELDHILGMLQEISSVQ